MNHIKALEYGYWRGGEDIKILGVLPHKSRKNESVIMGTRWKGNYFTAKWDGVSRYWLNGEYDLDKDEAMQSFLKRAGVKAGLTIIEVPVEC